MDSKFAAQLKALRENKRRVPLSGHKVQSNKKPKTLRVKDSHKGRFLGWCKTCGLPAMEPDVTCPRCGLNPLELLHCEHPPFSFRKGVKIVEFEARNSVGTMLGGAVIGETLKGVAGEGRPA